MACEDNFIMDDCGADYNLGVKCSTDIPCYTQEEEFTSSDIAKGIVRCFDGLYYQLCSVPTAYISFPHPDFWKGGVTFSEVIAKVINCGNPFSSESKSLGLSLYYLDEEVTIDTVPSFSARALSEVKNLNSPVSNAGSVFTALRACRIIVSITKESTVLASAANASTTQKMYSLSRLKKAGEVDLFLSHHSRSREMVNQVPFIEEGVSKSGSMQNANHSVTTLDLEAGDVFTAEFSVYIVDVDGATIVGRERSTVQITEIARTV